MGFDASSAQVCLRSVPAYSTKHSMEVLRRNSPHINHHRCVIACQRAAGAMACDVRITAQKVL